MKKKRQLKWRVWEARVECRWHGKVAWKSNKDTTPTKWKTSTNEDKWRTTTTTKWTKINKNLQRFSQASTIAGSFWLFYGYWWLFVIYVNNYLWLLWLFYDYLWLFVIIKCLFVIILLKYIIVVCIVIIYDYFMVIDNYLLLFYDYW